MSSSVGVCLILPHGATRSRAYVAFPVDEAMTARSPVMETLIETEGVTNLPEDVSAADFLKWCEAKPDSASALPTEDLCKALRVADRMCDTNTDKLAKAVASKLTSRAWNGAEDSVALQRELQSLDRNLQHLVLRQSRDSVSTVLSAWPIELQQAYVNMLVAHEGKTYEVQAEHPPETVDSLLGLLSKTPSISPGLQSIHIHPAIATDTTATAAGHALRHHASSLASLTMTPPAADDAAPAAVLRALPHLTLLTNLHLTFADPCPRYGTAAADAVRLLTAAIPALPALARFYLFDLRTATYMQLPKRGGQRLRVPAGRPTLQTLADALCDAPALTSLTLGHATPKNAVPLPCRALRAPLPALCELRLIAFRACIGAVTDSAIPDRHISVPPLPALTSFAYIGSREPLTCSDVAAVTASVAQHKQLRSLELTLWHLPTGGEPIVAEALRSLPHLDVLDLGFGPSHVHSVRSMHSIMSAVAYHTGLTRLECLIECLPELGEAGPADGREPMPMPDMLTPLTALRALRALVFGNKTLGGIPRTDEALLVPLSGFTRLTSLVANCGNFSADAPRMAAAWARLPELRRLQFHLLRCPEPAALAACMAPLTAVTELRLAAMPVTAALVRAFAEAAAALTALEVAELVSGAIRPNHTGQLVEEYGDPDWIEGLLHLPCRGRFEFKIRNDEITEAEFERVRRKLVEKGACVAPRCKSVSFVPPDA